MGLFNAVMALSGMIDTDVIEDERLARPAELAPKRQLAGIAGQNLEVHMLR